MTGRYQPYFRRPRIIETAESSANASWPRRVSKACRVCGKSSSRTFCARSNLLNTCKTAILTVFTPSPISSRSHLKMQAQPYRLYLADFPIMLSILTAKFNQATCPTITQTLTTLPDASLLPFSGPSWAPCADLHAPLPVLHLQEDVSSAQAADLASPSPLHP